MHDSPEVSAVFLDPTGRRWRRVRRVAIAVGIVSSLLGAALVIGVLVPPDLTGVVSGMGAAHTFASIPKFALISSAKLAACGS